MNLWGQGDRPRTLFGDQAQKMFGGREQAAQRQPMFTQQSFPQQESSGGWMNRAAQNPAILPATQPQVATQQRPNVAVAQQPQVQPQNAPPVQQTQQPAPQVQQQPPPSDLQKQMLEKLMAIPAQQSQASAPTIDPAIALLRSASSPGLAGGTFAYNPYGPTPRISDVAAALYGRR